MFDCEYQDYMVCPACGYVERDSWEFGDSDGDTTCNTCGAEFSVSVEVTRHYTTFIRIVPTSALKEES